MTSRTRFWYGVLVLLALVSLVAVWFAARHGEPWHATVHVVLAAGLALWAQRLRLRGAAP